MAVAFEALAERHRRRILDLLRQGERPVGDLVAGLDVCQPAVSKHLRVRQVTRADVAELGSSWASRLGIPGRRPAWVLVARKRAEPGGVYVSGPAAPLYRRTSPARVAAP